MFCGDFIIYGREWTQGIHGCAGMLIVCIIDPFR